MSLTLPEPLYLQSLILSLSLLILSECKVIYLGSAIFKTAASLSFFLGGLNKASPTLRELSSLGWSPAFSSDEGHRYALLMIVGLGFSVLGDVLLIPSKQEYHAFQEADMTKPNKGRNREGDSLAFKAGTLFFALAHISYIFAFAYSPKRVAFGWLRFTASAGAVLLTSRWLGVFGTNTRTKGSVLAIPSDMEPLVRAYVTIISTMVGVASATDAGIQTTIGAWMFMISDMFVAVDTFGTSKPLAGKGSSSRPRWKFRSVGWAFYFFANFILAGSI